MKILDKAESQLASKWYHDRWIKSVQMNQDSKRFVILEIFLLCVTNKKNSILLKWKSVETINQSINNIIIIIINSITNQSCDHAVLKSNIHAEKFKRLKNSYLNLLYTYCNLSVVCSNYLASVMSTSLDYEFSELMQASELMWVLLCSSNWQKKIYEKLSQIFL